MKKFLNALFAILDQFHLANDAANLAKQGKLVEAKKLMSQH